MTDLALQHLLLGMGIPDVQMRMMYKMQIQMPNRPTLYFNRCNDPVPADQLDPTDLLRIDRINIQVVQVIYTGT